MAASGCHYCGTTGVTMRPYGPGATDVCHDCAFATPERRAATEAAMDAMANAAAAASPTGVVAITESEGFVPWTGPLPRCRPKPTRRTNGDEKK